MALILAFVQSFGQDDPLCAKDSPIFSLFSYHNENSSTVSFTTLNKTWQSEGVLPSLRHSSFQHIGKKAVQQLQTCMNIETGGLRLTV